MQFDVLTGTTLIDWQVLIVIMTAIIQLEINWHNLNTLIEWEVRTLSKDVKKMDEKAVQMAH